jgi:hypothetical protein
LINYTLDEARDFCYKLFPASDLSEENNPKILIESTLYKRYGFYGIPVDYFPGYDLRAPVVKKISRILFDLSLEELVPLINETEPFISFIEWRLKLGK